jgi:hypothetical protein
MVQEYGFRVLGLGFGFQKAILEGLREVVGVNAHADNLATQVKHRCLEAASPCVLAVCTRTQTHTTTHAHTRTRAHAHTYTHGHVWLQVREGEMEGGRARVASARRGDGYP